MSSSLATIPSTGTCPAEWRAWWNVEAVIQGTDWASLHRQHCEAWRRLRALAEPFTTGLSTYAPGTAP
jgi:hypothetical protein